MGQRIPKPPIEFGRDCGSCTPALWPAGETPKFIYCMFWDIVGCGVGPNDPPNGEIFKMEQSATIDCLWISDGSVWKPDYHADVVGPVGSRLRLLDAGGFSFFIDTNRTCRAEYFTYTNDQAACILAYAGSAGFGSIWWNQEVTDLISAFGLGSPGKLFYELFGFTGVLEVHKFTDLYQKTNVKILTV